MYSSKLLIVACSRRKQLTPEPLPAIDRYDGPTFRVIRKFSKTYPSSPLDISILSAKYGLISADQPLPYYDYRMTHKQAELLQPIILRDLEIALSRKPYQNLLILLGQDYFRALAGYEKLVPTNLSVQIADGGLGRKLSILHQWLYEDYPDSASQLPNPGTQKTAIIKGIQIQLSVNEIVDIARQAIAQGDPKATRHQTWYVLIDDQKVSLKWLVSKLTGLPVREFHTDRAKQVLAQLGVEIQKV